MYCTRNFSTKKQLKEAVAAGQDVGVMSAGIGKAPTDGEVSVEGPWAPQPHRWYARVVVKNGSIVKVK